MSTPVQQDTNPVILNSLDSIYLGKVVTSTSLSMTAYERASARDSWVELPETAGRDELMAALATMKVSDFGPADGTGIDLRLPLVQVANILCFYFNPGVSCAWPPQSKIMEQLGIDDYSKTKATLIMLQKSGLFGVEPSSGQGVSTRYYPLFHARGLSRFQALHNEVSREIADSGQPPF
ncbi:hypothetical protein [Citricoccus nitrophenolicus]|uniref:hypothetical protein n=1 Tax=Citricoccus nitrophenolicus TaxID=863575 RepID=UPI0031E645DD